MPIPPASWTARSTTRHTASETNTLVREDSSLVRLPSASTHEVCQSMARAACRSISFSAISAWAMPSSVIGEPNSSRPTARSTAMSCARRAAPSQRMQCVRRAGASRTWAAANPLPGSPRTSSSGTKQSRR